MPDTNLTDFLGSWSAQVKELIEPTPLPFTTPTISLSVSNVSVTPGGTNAIVTITGTASQGGALQYELTRNELGNYAVLQPGASLIILAEDDLVPGVYQVVVRVVEIVNAGTEDELTGSAEATLTVYVQKPLTPPDEEE